MSFQPRQGIWNGASARRPRPGSLARATCSPNGSCAGVGATRTGDRRCLSSRLSVIATAPATKIDAPSQDRKLSTRRSLSQEWSLMSLYRIVVHRGDSTAGQPHWFCRHFHEVECDGSVSLYKSSSTPE